MRRVLGLDDIIDKNKKINNNTKRITRFKP